MARKKPKFMLLLTLFIPLNWLNRGSKKRKLKPKTERISV
jgi:hypothetical protein